MNQRYYAQQLLIFCLLISTSFGLVAQVNTVILTGPSGNWVPPVGCSSFYVEMWGGGAGGNTGSGDGSLSTGGGGGGSYAKSTTFFVNSSQFNSGYQYVLGTGGSPGSSGNDTWFYNTLCLAPGGKTRGNAQQKSPINLFVQTSNYGGGGGSSWRNIFNQIWHGGGGGAGRRSGDGYSGGNADFNFTGGGADGYAYDNNDVSKGRGGKDGAYFPGIPGGGGAGNQSGADGIIIITYTCAFGPGSIGTNHTIPFPQEFPPFTDVLTNEGNPASFGYSNYWQARKDNTQWQTISSMGTGLAAFVQDTITRNTFYRRAVTGCGTTNNFTDSVWIRVFTATSGKNGKITGRVTSVNGTTGVGGVTITAKKTFALKGSPQSFPYTAITNSNGEYVIPDIFYGDRDNGDRAFVGFTIVASLTGHRLSTRDTITLSYNTNVSEGNNFIDSTVYSVTGRVTQTCNDCLPGYTDPIGVGSVKISANTAGIIDVYTDSLRQDSIGYFGMAIANPGSYTFTPSFLNHKFNPTNQTVSVTGDRFNINFLDTTTRLISGKLTDVAGRRIGAATLLFEGIYQRPDSLPITTFKKRARMNTGDSTYSVRLPAGRYKVSVDSFFSAFLINDDRYIREDSIKNFFKNLAIEPLIDVSTKDSVRNLVYHRPPVVKIFGLKDTACNSNPAKNPGLVFRTNVRKRFEAFVYEGPESIGDKVQIFNAGNDGDTLANYLRFYTNVTKRGATENADTLFFRLKNTVQLQLPMIDSFLVPGAPNFSGDFTKPFQVYYFDRYGRKATVSPSTPIPSKATVVGTFNPTNTFTTVSPEIPFLILHQPPGDKSYSFWSKDSSIQTSTTIKAASQNGVDGFANVSLGPSVSVGGDVGPVSVSIDVSVIASLNYTHQNLVIADTLDEMVTTTTIKSRFQTNPSPIFTEDISGDVYIGNAMNYILGKSITVDFIPLRQFGQCEIETASRLFMAPDSVKTEFVYTENNLEKVVIPTQQRLADEATTDSARLYHETQVAVWRQVIDNNKLNKKNATFIRNRSFSAGPGIDYSEETSRSSTNTITWETMVSNNFAAELGLYVGGQGASGGVAITLQQTTGGSKSTNTSATNEIGYHLEDDDVDGTGDYFSINIKKDSVYGTPVFDLYAGTSSCPPEQDAQNRDQPQILSGDMRFDNIGVDSILIFPIIITNKSESGEPRFYRLTADGSTSNGLIIGRNLINDLVTTPADYYIPFGESISVDIFVRKANRNNPTLSYPDVELYLSDICSDGPYVWNSYSTAKLTFNYTSPCGGINLTAPAEGFVLNTTSNNTLPVTMSNYILNNIDSITLQYKKDLRRNLDPWKTGFTVKRASINDPNSFTNSWDISGLQDTVYNLRLRLVCTNGNLIYSDVVSGVIDRELPFLLGAPQPITGVYNPGSSEISFTYSEPVDISNLNNGTVELVRRSNNTIVPVTVSALENKVIITPVNDLGLQSDSFRVIVRNIADRYGNNKPTADTSFFKLGNAAPPVYTGTNIATVHVIPASIEEQSQDSVAVYFRLRERTTRVTKVYFTVSGTALEGADYSISYDTVKVKRCNNPSCTDFTLIPVSNNFIGYPGYINIDSNQTEAILYLHPNADALVESNETIRITLVAGGEYKLQDSAQATATIIDAAAVCPAGNVLYVNRNASGNNSGVSWQHAMTSLQDALNRSCAGITQIWVAGGTYKPTTGDSRDSAFRQKNNVAIYGGFAGNETMLSQRNWRANPTILSGDIGIANENNDNSFNVVRNVNNGLNSTAVLDGFIITGGNANKGDYFGNRGGSVHNFNSAPSYYNCVFRGSSAVEYGGGMFNQNGAPLLINCVFSGNRALFGGGLYNESASTQMINCSFSGNLATAEGGAMSTFGAVTPQITNSILWGNSSGIRDAGGSTPAISNSIIQGGYAGTGNLNVDPLFIDQIAPALSNLGDLRLQGCSPAINVGNNAALPGAITRDLAGNPRIVSSTVDLGAYERPLQPLSTIIYVDANATGNNTGESWANAYTSLRSALTELNFCLPGTTVLIAAGTYTATASATFNFNKLDAVILGGYPTGGGIRNPPVYRSILKGNVQVLKSLKIDGVEVQQ